jgi:Domain of unknown function (DUF2610)
MKRFTVVCDFAGVKAPFHVYIGEPCADEHPLHYQAQWLASMRSGTVPVDVMDSFKRLQVIALENSVSFEDLCVYAMGSAADTEASAGTGKADAEGDTER